MGPQAEVRDICSLFANIARVTHVHVHYTDTVTVQLCVDVADKRMMVLDAVALAGRIRSAVETVAGVDIVDVHLETGVEAHVPHDLQPKL